MSRSRRFMAAGALAGALAAAPPAAASSQLVISQVYGGGGNSGAPLRNDYVELFNRGTAPLALGGMALQYASAGGSFGATLTTPLTDVTLQPGQAYLVQQAAGANQGAAPLPTPDASGSVSMSATDGKVRLVDESGEVLDLVGYGGANSFEGAAAAPRLSNSTSAVRAGGGCLDTGDNRADFRAGDPAPRTTSSPAQPCPADAAPAVTGTAPADGATGVAPDADLTVTFSEPVDAAPGAFALACDGAAVAAAVGGGPETFVLDPAGELPTSASCTLTVRAAGVTDRDGTPDPPDGDRVVRFATLERCGDRATSVPAIQGDGSRSPLAGERVSTEGVVVADFQGPTGDGALDGFFLQDPAGDGDPRTSDGVFVYDRDATPDVQEGDRVRVTGTVEEFRRAGRADTMTELTGVTVTPCGGAAPLPAAAVLALPQDRAALERLEGMLVRTTQDLTVTELYNLGFGEVLLSTGRPLVQPTEVMPGGPGAAAADHDNTRRTILLDDGRSSRNLDPIRFTSEADALRRGDVVGPVEGALAFDFDQFRIQPTAEPRIAERNPRPASAEDVGGDVTVGSFNVLNYFVTFGRREDRGAADGRAFAAQRAKVVAAIERQDASVVALQEIQDTSDEPAFGGSPDGALDDLVAALNAAAGYAKWAKSPAPNPFGNTDEIRVAQIFQPAEVALAGHPIALPDPVFADLARVPVAQTYRAGTERFTVVVNHFKSKGCGGATGADADQGDGQSCFNAARVRQAEALLRFASELRRATDDEDVLVVGDLNAYSAEDPVRALEAGGLANLHAAHEPPEERYSYVFMGRQGTLDHALGTPSLAGKVTGTDLWHVNADEARVEEYDGLAELYTADPYRSSDHDASTVGIDASQPPTCEGRTATIVGTPDDDVIHAGTGEDVIVTFEGDDVVDGGNGDDVVCAGTGDDRVHGGNGDDVLRGGPGDDDLDGGRGDDDVAQD